jgi:acid phosphatase
MSARLFAKWVAAAAFVVAALQPQSIPAESSAPRIDHVVIIVEENHSFRQIIGDGDAPYINSLAAKAAVFTNAHAITHPSQPNYFALFSGLLATNGDGCPPQGIPPDAPNLGSEILTAHRSFAGFAETMPRVGFTGCSYGKYARKHAPWVQFTNIPPADNRPFSALKSFDQLPTIAMIIPNLDNDMHDGSIEQADRWLRANIAPLLAWGQTHNMLFVLTWDEGGGFDPSNQIPTIFYGPMVKPGNYPQRIDDYAVLRTLEDAFHLEPTGKAASAAPITGWWR